MSPPHIDLVNYLLNPVTRMFLCKTKSVHIILVGAGFYSKNLLKIVFYSEAYWNSKKIMACFVQATIGWTKPDTAHKLNFAVSSKIFSLLHSQGRNLQKPLGSGPAILNSEAMIWHYNWSILMACCHRSSIITPVQSFPPGFSQT